MEKNNTVYVKINSVKAPKSATFVAPKRRSDTTIAIPFKQTEDELNDTVYTLRVTYYADAEFDDNKESVSSSEFIFAADRAEEVIKFAEDKMTEAIVLNAHAAITNMFVTNNDMYYNDGWARGIQMINRKNNTIMKLSLVINNTRVK